MRRPRSGEAEGQCAAAAAGKSRCYRHALPVTTAGAFA